MPSALFVTKDSRKIKTMISGQAEFQRFCSSIALKQRKLWYGYPYGNAYSVKLFQNDGRGEINPFWIHFFGDDLAETITYEEADALVRRQRPIPPSRRLSQDKDPGKKRKRVAVRIGRGRWARVPRINLKPSFDYSADGRGTYVGQYASWGAINNLHRVRQKATTKTSVNTPGFFKLSKYQQRLLPWHNFSMSQDVFQEDTATYRVYSPGSDLRATGYLRGSLYGGYRGVDMASLMNDTTKTSSEAMSKALQRAKATNVNLMQILGERKQTVSLLTSSVNRLASLALAIKKGDVKHIRQLINGYQKTSYRKYMVWHNEHSYIIGRRYYKVVKDIPGKVSPMTFANAWLEYSYGWKPLLSDIYGSMELLANTYHMPKALRVSARKLEVRTTTPSTHQRDRNVRTVTDSTRVVLEFAEPTEWTNTMSKTGVSNPALLAWELLPYSFVIDWFVPIGTYLSNMDALLGLNFIRGSTTTRLQVVLDSTFVATAANETVTGGNLHCEKVSKVRSVYTTVPFPPIPRFAPNIGVEKSLSAISLLSQIFSGGKTTVRV